jgi:hypothetical protein
MRAAAREFFTVDLRGLRAALTARAASRGVTESDVLRSALDAVLGSDARSATIVQPGQNDDPARTGIVKLSVRLTVLAAHHLDRNARAAGLSRGTYLTQLIDGAPPVTASTDRAAGTAALSASSTELALLSRDIHHLTQLLSRGAVEAARQYRERLEHLDADVRAHLDRAAFVLADLSPVRTRTGHAPSVATRHRSSP